MAGAIKSTTVQASLHVTVPTTATNPRSYSDTSRFFKTLEGGHVHCYKTAALRGSVQTNLTNSNRIITNEM